MYLIGLILFVLLAFGCGVKGDPQPPERLPKLGRGTPTYHRATQEFAYPTLPPLRDEENEKNIEEEEE